MVLKCLQLVSNIVIGCESAQNTLRDIEGLLYVLSLCGTDIDHPLRREWAILCMRNACEGNLENQKCIEELTLQKVSVVNEQLTRSGLSVDFNSETGKIKFSYQS